MSQKKFSFEKIRENLDIVEIVSQYVTLKRSGSNFMALCPFHTEKTPSFVVSPQKQIFHCFGCGKGGDVIKFVSEINGLEYYDAAVKLAKDYNLQFEFKEYSNINTFFEITETVAEIYHKYLKDNFNKGAVKNYIKKRNLTEKAIETFKIGYAPDNSKFLLNKLKERNINLKLAKEIGILKKDREFYDTFRNRIIFPIRNLKGEFIAFGGRTLKENFLPKYLNSPESLIYHKRKNLYGLFENRDNIKKKKEIIVVEGYMDLISLYSNNVDNVVATLGTAFTLEQLNLISRFTDNIYFLFDGDKAGIKASIKSSIVAINKDFNPKIIYIKDNEDPDDFIKKNGVEEFLKLKNKGYDLVNFLKNIIFSSINLKNLENRIRLMERLKKIYLDIDNPLYRDHFIKAVGEILNLEYNEVKKHFSKSKSVFKYKEENKAKEVKIKIEEEIITILLKNQQFLENINSEWFSNVTYKKLINLLKEKKNLPDLLELEEFSKEEKYIIRFLALNDKYSGNEKIEEVFNKLIRRLKKNYYNNKLKDIINKIKKEEKEGNEKSILLLMKEQKLILDNIKNLD